jgi:N utilization substance protein A
VNFASVVEDLVYDKGLDKGRVLEIVGQGIVAAYKAKCPNLEFRVVLTKDSLAGFEVTVKKQVVSNVTDANAQISLKKARAIDLQAEEGAELFVPIVLPLGRIDILVAKGSIAEAIKRLEQDHVYQIFNKRVGELVTGSLHKQEFSGYAVNLGDVIAFLPKSCTPPIEFKSGAPIKAIIREVLQYTGKGYQVVLDRASVDYVVKIFELEIPEIFEGIIEIVKAERICGYKTKLLVRSKAKNIDPVGSCVGIAGSRIKPILSELGKERIDLIPWVEDQELLLRKSLKPGEIQRIDFSPDGTFVEVWVNSEEKPLIIGKNGGNVNLASRILGVQIKVHEESFGQEVDSE